MTKRELLARLKECAEMDEEGGHYEADKALLEFIGDPEITKAFEALHRWYA
jgi:hypothetical protein